MKKTGFGLKITKKDIERAKKADELEANSPGEDENGLDLGLNNGEEDTVTETTEKNIIPQQRAENTLKTDDYTEVKNRIISATLRDKRK